MYNFPIKLSQNEIFVFGSNAGGFHGAGAAGYAFRGTPENTWRQDKMFLCAMKSPVGSPERIGRWAVYGVAHGCQVGHDGKSYAIETVKKAGQKRSTGRREIYYQLVSLISFAKKNPDYRFLIAPLGTGGAGYTNSEMKEVWQFLHSKHGIPDYFILPPEITKE